MKSRSTLIGILSTLSLVACSSGDGSFTIDGSMPGGASNGKIRAAEVLAGSPSSFSVTLYEVYLSENEDCSDPVLLKSFGEDGETFDMATSPTIFSGSPPDGTYPCLIMRFSDVMKFKPDQVAVDTHAGCTDTDTEYSFDVFRTPEFVSDDEWIDLNGDASAGTGTPADPSDDRPYAFASTSTEAGSVLAHGVAVSEHQMVRLTSPLVVPGHTTFFVDSEDSVTNLNEGGDDYCWLEKADLGFE